MRNGNFTWIAALSSEVKLRAPASEETICLRTTRVESEYKARRLWIGNQIAGRMI